MAASQRRPPAADRPTGPTPTLATPLKILVGGRTAARLAKASLVTASDLLRHYPRKYTTRGELTPLAGLTVGEAATVWARIASIDTKPLGRSAPHGRPRHLTRIAVTDGSRSLQCTFFNQPWLGKQLSVGEEVLLSGTVSAFHGVKQMTSPEIATDDGRIGDAESVLQVLESFAGGVIPVYPQTAGVTTSILQQSVKQVLAVMGEIVDPLPRALVTARGLVDLATALTDIHRPAGRDALAAAQRRLRFDEALALQLVLARRRAEAAAEPGRPCPPTPARLADAFDAALPFELTAGQRAVGDEISRDLGRAQPMNRLLQGDVGAGKTVVALRAMLQVVDAGCQAALLAPTEVLAAQHARSLRALLGPLGRGGELESVPGATTVTLLTGSMRTPAKRRALTEIASGAPGIVVGTHALLSDAAQFTNLGLVVVDEQHRFGVEQRDVLRTRGPGDQRPHVLVMTATPIPRTVAMTVYGDLDVSTLGELPGGRRPVATTVVPAAEKPAWLDRVWRRVAEEVAAGHQAFIVCPRIGDDGSGSADDGEDGAWPGGTDVYDDAAAPFDGGPAARSPHGAGNSGAGRSGVGRPGGEHSRTGAAAEGPRAPLAVVDVARYLAGGPLKALRLAELTGRMAPDDKDSVMRGFAAGEIDVLVATTVIEVGVDVANATVMVVMDADRFGMSQLHQLRGRVGRGAAPAVCLLVTDAPAAVPSRARLDAVAATTDGFRLAEADLDLRREGDVLGTSQAGRQTSLRLLSLRRDVAVIADAKDDAAALVADDPTLAAYPALASMADAIVDPDSQDYLDKG